MTNTINRPMGVTEWTWLLVLSVIWGGSFFFIAVAIKELPVFTVVLLRVGLAALFLNIFIRFRGLSLPVDPASWRSFFVIGLLNNALPFSLLVWGQTHIASGLASILNATTPLFTVLVAHSLTQDEKITPARLSGVVVGLAGATLIIGPDLLLNLGSHSWGQLAILGTALSYAFASIYGRKFSRAGVAPMVTATAQVTTATTILMPLVLMVDRPWQLAMPQVSTIMAIVTLALLCTGIAYIIYFRILATAGATNLMLVTFLAPAGAILLGATFLDEQLALRHFAGMGLIGAGLVAIDGRLLKLIKKQFLQ